MDNLKPFKQGFDPRRNVTGKNKGSRSLKSMLKELLSAEEPTGEWSKGIAAQLIRKAFKDGDMRAIQEIIDRIEGKLITGPLMSQTNLTSVSMPVVEKNGKPMEFRVG